MDIKIGQSFDANTPIDDILGAIRINPEPEINLDPEPLHVNIDMQQIERDVFVREIEGRNVFTINHEQARNLANGSVEEAKRWAQETFGIEDEYVAYTVTAAGIGMHRALSDLGLVLEYEITFRVT